MMNRQTAVAVAVVSILAACALVTSGAEKLDRGLVALQRDDGSVFLSWRLLQDDPPDITFRSAAEIRTDNSGGVFSSGQGDRLTYLVD